jgi:Tol biopolymer transport system component
MQPDWAPDGLSLAYISDRARLKNGTLDPAAWRLTLSNSARVQVSTTNQYTGGVDFPRWRPGRGADLLYTLWAYEPQTLAPYGQLILQDTVSNQKQALTPAGQTAFQPSWSPDGSYIAFITRNGNQDDVSIMPVSNVAPAISVATPTATASAGSDAVRTIFQGVAAHPVWSPDGHSLAWVGLKDGSFDLFTQRLDDLLQPSGSPTQLTTGLHLEAASSISWGP